MPTITLNEITQLLKAKRIEREEKYSSIITPFQNVVEHAPNVEATFKNYKAAEVTIGGVSDITQEQSQAMRSALRTFYPWRKGPFRLFGIDIDAEWRSDLKYNRIRDALGEQSDKAIADVGCGNGYFMFRLLEKNPRFVVGLDPTWRYYFNFLLLQKYAREPRLHIEPLGWDQLSLLRNVFDTILCMGIVYHHRDPILVLEACYNSLRKGGVALIESMTIPLSRPVVWSAGSRYANVGGVWYVPTATALEHWVRRAGFKSCERISHIKLTQTEQRRTPWADVNSLAESLNEKGNRTIKGYPAPWRTIVLAKK